MSTLPPLRRGLGSVRFRLTLWFVAILALVLTVFSVFIYTRQTSVLVNETRLRLAYQSGRLDAYYQTLLHTLDEREHSEGNPTVPVDQPLLQEGDVLALVAANNQVLQQSANFLTDELAAVMTAGEGAVNSSRPVAYRLQGGDAAHPESRSDYLFSFTPLGFDKKIVAMLVLGSPVDPGGQLPRLALTLTAAALIVVLAAFGGGFWLADRAMRPVQVITRAAREIGEGDLSRRLDLKRADELGELADTFDQMLARLQAAFERQRQFTADASHELRTPLTIIELESNRALEHRRSPEEYTAALGVIQSENEWMSRLVNELLTLARMDAEQTVLRSEALDLSDLAVEAVGRLMPVAQSSAVTLETGELGEGSVSGDRVYLTQMVTNLVENAIKHAGGAGIRVLVETGSQMRQGKAGGWLSVSDNGQGIAPEHLPHLFERFYRVDAARSRENADAANVVSSSGLGLAIVQSVVQAHGGTVEVSSRPGEGTRFTVWLPAVL